MCLVIVNGAYLILKFSFYRANSMRNLSLVEVFRVDGQSNPANYGLISIDFDTKHVYCGTNEGINSIDPSTHQVCLHL